MTTFFQRQIDIFPILFSVLALYFLIKKNNSASWIFLIIAILFKSYPLLLLPIWVVKHIKSKDYLNLAVGFVLLLISQMVVVGLFNSPEYTRTVINNGEEFRLILARIDLGVSWQTVLIAPAVFIFLTMLLLTSDLKDLEAVWFSALFLSIPVLFSPSTIMWWSWSIPFFAISALERDYGEKWKFGYLIFTFQPIQFVYACYYEWSFLFQWGMWRGRSWPLKSSVMSIIEPYIGAEKTIYLRDAIFTSQWTLHFFCFLFILVPICSKFRITISRTGRYDSAKKSGKSI
jgi:hypothetical protein